MDMKVAENTLQVESTMVVYLRDIVDVVTPHNTVQEYFWEELHGFIECAVGYQPVGRDELIDLLLREFPYDEANVGKWQKMQLDKLVRVLKKIPDGVTIEHAQWFTQYARKSDEDKVVNAVKRFNNLGNVKFYSVSFINLNLFDELSLYEIVLFDVYKASELSAELKKFINKNSVQLESFAGTYDIVFVEKLEKLHELIAFLDSLPSNVLVVP